MQNHVDGSSGADPHSPIVDGPQGRTIDPPPTQNANRPVTASAMAGLTGTILGQTGFVPNAEPSRSIDPGASQTDHPTGTSAAGQEEVLSEDMHLIRSSRAFSGLDPPHNVATVSIDDSTAFHPHRGPCSCNTALFRMRKCYRRIRTLFLFLTLFRIWTRHMVWPLLPYSIRLPSTDVARVMGMTPRAPISVLHG